MRVIRSYLAIGLVSLSSCDLAEFASTPPPATCTEFGAQCQLSKGPLGVCETSPCPREMDPPCFECTPQH